MEYPNSFPQLYLNCYNESNIPVIFISAHAMMHAEHKTFHNTYPDKILKTISPSELVDETTDLNICDSNII